MEKTEEEIALLENALEQLKLRLKYRLDIFFNNAPVYRDPDFPAIQREPDILKAFGNQNFNEEEYLLLLLAIAPHIQPDFLDTIISEHLPQAGDFPQIGGHRGKSFRGFLPTGETALFLLAGGDFSNRIRVQKYFEANHFFSKNHILWLETVPEGEPHMSGKLIVSQDYIDLLTVGYSKPPQFSMNFPAQQLETEMDWEDLILDHQTFLQVQELKHFIHHGKTLFFGWGMKKRLKPGFRVLFHGPPGTGKTLTASLLGKFTGKPVYRIDLSMVISKFIGETEKNLANLFSRAENKDWILFFDEADALFGKRTNVRDAHDKYANQEVAYLLQRVEQYDGLVILASNFKSNIDEAFMRRFQAIINFPFPKTQERLRLWQQSFPPQIKMSPDVQLPAIAQKYDLTGANIINIVHFCCLSVLGNKLEEVNNELILEGTKRELSKEGKLLN